MKKKRSKAAEAGYIVACMGIVACTLAMIMVSFAVCIGLITISVEKMLAIFIIAVLFSTRVGGDKYH